MTKPHASPSDDDAGGSDTDDATDATESRGDSARDSRQARRQRSLASRATALLERARTEPVVHAGALCVSIGVGLALAWVHWLGLVAGGAAVGLVSPTRTRAVLGGIGFGLVVLGAFALTLGTTTRIVLEMTPVVYATVASAVGLAALGSLIRVAF